MEFYHVPNIFKIFPKVLDQNRSKYFFCNRDENIPQKCTSQLAPPECLPSSIRLSDQGIQFVPCRSLYMLM